MTFDFFARIPLKAILLLCLSYIWLGWYLSSNHVVWLVGTIVLCFVSSVVWQTTSWLQLLIEFGSKTLVVVLFLSASVALVAGWSLLSSLILMPLATTMLTNMELRLAGLERTDRFLLLIVVAGLGLAVGEGVDILFLPSMRY